MKKYFLLKIFLPLFIYFFFIPGSLFITISSAQGEEIKFEWYERKIKKRAFISFNEITVFPKKGFASVIDEKTLLKQFSLKAKISKKNNLVFFLKSDESFSFNALIQKISSLKYFENVSKISPVFYTSDEKKEETRMALTGEIIVCFPIQFTSRQIETIEREYALTKKASFRLLENTFIYEAGDPLDSLIIANKLYNSSKVLYSYPNWLRGREKKTMPDDTLFPDQWHLLNTGQAGGTAGEDVNIISIWDTYKGSAEEVIAIIDDGLEIGHEDLSQNIIQSLCWDYEDGNNDPTAGDHGTSCAGVAAGRGFNNLGITGAAPSAGLVGYRILDTLTDSNEADAFMRNNDAVDIYSNSWGPYDDGKRLEGPGPLAEDALEQGVQNGRGGLGSIYVWAGGNGGDNGDNSNYDGYANSRFTIAVAASTNCGTHPYYSESGANIIINAPSDGGTAGITTTDRTGLLGGDNGNYTDNFGGTSSSTALVSGIIALMLEANSYLSWRDVQHILISTAKKNDSSDTDWHDNGAGYSVNNKYGFGRIDAEAAVSAAENWIIASSETSLEASSNPNMPIPDNDDTGVYNTIYVPENIRIEFIEIYFSATDHPAWENLEIILTSPTGTQSVLAKEHYLRRRTEFEYNNWRFGSIRHFGEGSQGEWTLKVKDLRENDTGTFQSWSLKIFGTEINEQADLSMKINSISGQAIAGQIATFDFGIENKGPSDTKNVLLTCYLPGSFEHAEYSMDNGFSWNNWTGIINLKTITAGSSINVLIKAQVNSSVSGEITTEAKILSSTFDPEISNNRRKLIVSAEQNADISIKKSVDKQSPVVGETIVFSIEAKNNGPFDAQQIEVYDELPQGLVYLNDDSNGSFDHVNNIWHVGSLEKEAAKSLNISVRALTSDQFSNTAIKTNSFPNDLNNENNSDSVTINTPFDNDRDGMPDEWETINNLDPYKDDSYADPDNDDLSNLEEYENKTDPNNKDTDSDAMPDGWEVLHGLNPLSDDAAMDLDNDGFTNYEEYTYNTNPNDDNSKPQPPIANAGMDKIVNEGTLVMLDCSASNDPDGTIESYLWEQTSGPIVTLSGNRSMMPTFVAPSVGKDGCELIFQVTVTDDDGFTNTDQVLIKVNDEKVNITNSGGGGCFIQAMDH